MSSLLLTNPFASQPPPPSGSGDQTTTQNTQTVQPAGESGGASNTENQTSGSGSGGSFGGGSQQSGTKDARNGQAAPRPSDATLNSVVDAQTQRQQSDEQNLQKARRTAIQAMSDARTFSLIGSLAKSPDTPMVLQKLPDVEMPDPLPTAPILLALKGNG